MFKVKAFVLATSKLKEVESKIEITIKGLKEAEELGTLILPPATT